MAPSQDTVRKDRAEHDAKLAERAAAEKKEQSGKEQQQPAK
jgi:hypothetical protein